MASSENLTILVTGFGDWQNHKGNPSGKIASSLPSSITHGNGTITIKTPPNPIRVSYQDIHTQVEPLIKEAHPEIILHIGLDDGSDAFHIERGANRDGYNQLPDTDAKVFSKTDTKKAFGKSASYISTSFDLDDVLKRWRAQVGKPLQNSAKKSKQVSMKATHQPPLEVTDDVGSFVCGLIYYQSLQGMRGTKPGLEHPVLFLHVPVLDTAESLDLGKNVTIALIKALAESYGR